MLAVIDSHGKKQQIPWRSRQKLFYGLDVFASPDGVHPDLPAFPGMVGVFVSFHHAPSSGSRFFIVAHRPESEHIVFEAPPLITKDRWEQLQKRLHSSNSRGGRPSRPSQEFLLHGLCQCGLCGAVMLAQYGTRCVDGTRSRNYVCYWHKASSKMRQTHIPHPFSGTG